MCVIIVAAADKQIPKEHIENAVAANPQGWGLGIRHDSGLVEMKHGFGAEKAWKAWRQAEGAYRVFHARVATSGETNLANCHPFDASHGTDGLRLFFHNGTLDIPRPNDKFCDSWHFAQYLRSFPTNESLIDAIAKYSQRQTSRFVLMDKNNVWRFGYAWQEKDGVHYSNHSCFHKRTTTYAIGNGGKTGDQRSLADFGGTGNYGDYWNQREQRDKYYKEFLQAHRFGPDWERIWELSLKESFPGGIVNRTSPWRIQRGTYWYLRLPDKPEFKDQISLKDGKPFPDDPWFDKDGKPVNKPLNYGVRTIWPMSWDLKDRHYPVEGWHWVPVVKTVWLDCKLPGKGPDKILSHRYICDKMVPNDSPYDLMSGAQLEWAIEHEEGSGEVGLLDTGDLSISKATGVRYVPIFIENMFPLVGMKNKFVPFGDWAKVVESLETAIRENKLRVRPKAPALVKTVVVKDIPDIGVVGGEAATLESVMKAAAAQGVVLDEEEIRDLIANEGAPAVSGDESKQ